MHSNINHHKKYATFRSSRAKLCQNIAKIYKNMTKYDKIFPKFCQPKPFILECHATQKNVQHLSLQNGKIWQNLAKTRGSIQFLVRMSRDIFKRGILLVPVKKCSRFFPPDLCGSERVLVCICVQSALYKERERERERERRMERGRGIWLEGIGH